MTLSNIQQGLEQLSDEELNEAIKIIKARTFSIEGFKAYFEIVFGVPVLPHWEEALELFFIKDDPSLVIEAFRGSSKTTTFLLGLGTYLIGHFPYESGIVIQVGDDSASDNAQQMADIIEYNPGWKKIFPHIVPDKDQGWGAGGYEVKLTHESSFMMHELDYSEWRNRNAKRPNPSLLGVGYRSRALIGKRPHWIIIDDIHDENNTASERELRKVKTILTGTIFPAANFSKFKIFIGTPWTESDALHYVKATGEFDAIKIPVYNSDGTPAWIDKFPEEEIQKQRRLAGEIEFARMFLLDLSKTKGLVLKKEWIATKWAHEQIREDQWEVFFGIDFTSTANPEKEKGDYFSITKLVILPGGKGGVIIPGIRERYTQADAEDAVVREAKKYPTLLTIGVEAVFSGNNFYNNLLVNAEIRANGFNVQPVRPQRSKGYKFEKELAPLFKKGILRLSDEEDEWILAFEKEWLNWQGDALEDLYHNDTLDSTWVAVQVAGGFLSPIVTHEARVTNPWWKDKKKESTNPFASLGRS